MTTIETITDEQIEALRTEAGAAGDMEQVAICDRALAGRTTRAALTGTGPDASERAERGLGDVDAIRECVEAIRDAEARA